MTIEDKILSILIGVDDTFSAAVFDTNSDLTISARAGMALIESRMGWPNGPHGIPSDALIALSSGLDNIEQDHCFGAIIGDTNRAQETITALAMYLDVASASIGGITPT